MKPILYILLCSLVGIFTVHSSAAIKGEKLDYKAGPAKLEGYIATDSKAKKHPAVLIVHDWMGITDFTRKKAEQLANEGYVALAADVYGANVRPKTQEEASKQASIYKSDRKLLRERVRAAYDQLASRPDVDPAKIVVMGYCFGGTAALELARSGAPVAGTATFHGGLSNPAPEDAKNIKGPVLVMHGGDDPYVPPKEVAAFKEEMARAKAPMEFKVYPGAVHAFAVPAAGNDKTTGAAYNAKADKASWQDFEKFLKSVVK
jgi:dienelactone hydrolase